MGTEVGFDDRKGFTVLSGERKENLEISMDIPRQQMTQEEIPYPKISKEGNILV